MFWLIHPEHGVMPAEDSGVVERNTQHGWTVLNEGPRPLRAKPLAAATMLSVAADKLLNPGGLGGAIRLGDASKKPGRPKKA